MLRYFSSRVYWTRVKWVSFNKIDRVRIWINFAQNVVQGFPPARTAQTSLLSMVNTLIYEFSGSIDFLRSGLTHFTHEDPTCQVI